MVQGWQLHIIEKFLHCHGLTVGSRVALCFSPVCLCCLFFPHRLPFTDIWTCGRGSSVGNSGEAYLQTCSSASTSWQIDSSAPSCLPACLSPCWSAPLRYPHLSKKTQLNKSVTFDRCLRSSCLLVLTKTWTYCKQQH